MVNSLNEISRSMNKSKIEQGKADARKKYSSRLQEKREGKGGEEGSLRRDKDEARKRVTG